MSKYEPVSAEVVAALQTALGAEYVRTDAETLEKYKTDEETDPRYHHLPEVVVWPGSTEEVAAVMKIANQYNVPVTPRSAGTSVSCGAIPVYGGIVLLLERMDKIEELNTEGMYMVVEAGARTVEIQEKANAAGFLYAGDPCSADSCLIGGNIATNAGGNKAVRYGTTRDQVYAIEAVTPTGDIVNVGARLKKKSTGYCLEQLIMGSEGTLGIITKATLKLQPIPPYRFDLLAVFSDPEQALDVVPKIMQAGINPTSVEYMDNSYVRGTAEYLEFKKDSGRTPKELLNEYIRMGGFPIVALGSFDERSSYQIVEGIYNSVITSDITRRHNITNFDLFNRVVKYVVENVGKTFSANAIVKFMKGEGRSLSVEAVYNYLEWLEKAFVIYRCQRYDMQGKTVLKTQEKFYLADASLKYCMMGFNPKSVAAMLENIVYFELRRKGYDVYIGKNATKEIDFVAVRRDERIYVQVCRNMPEESDREVANLLEIKDHYPKYVVTMDELAAGNINGVKIVHLADFLLSKEY